MVIQNSLVLKKNNKFKDKNQNFMLKREKNKIV